ncbi:MAG: hypothetical protein ACKO4S_16700 [Snowella sp.]
MNKKSDASIKDSVLDADKSSEIIGALAKGAIGSAVTIAGAVTGLGAVAIVGPFAVEAFNLLIPNQRQSRVEKLLKILSSKICNMSEKEVEQRFHTPEFLDIFEDCISQAVRAVSDDRLENLASVLEKSLTDEQIKYLQNKRLLSILSELNDVEVIILQSYGYMNPNTSEFRDQHKSIFQNAVIHGDTSQKEQEENAMYINYRDHLINLGLIGPHRLGESQLFLTQLGKMLLKILGRSETVELVIGTTVNPVIAMENAEQGFLKMERDSKINNKPNDNPLGLSKSQQNRKLAEELFRSNNRF